MKIVKLTFFFLVLSEALFAAPAPSSDIFCKPQKQTDYSLVENSDRGFFSHPHHLGIGFAEEKEANLLYQKNFAKLKETMKSACNNGDPKEASEFISKISRECTKLCESSTASNTAISMCAKKCDLNWTIAASYLEGYADAVQSN